MKCSPEAHRALHAAFSDLARAYPGMSAAAWKNFILTELPRYDAEASGREIPPPIKRESTLHMNDARMGLALEFVSWFCAGAGVNTTKIGQSLLATFDIND